MMHFKSVVPGRFAIDALPATLPAALVATLVAALAATLVATPMGAQLDTPTSAVPMHLPDRRAEQAPSTSSSASSGRVFLGAQDTVNGQPITDPVLIRRIETIAHGLPPGLLASHGRAAQVRYLAQGFEAGDDAPTSYGVFRDPAAALAFGCAMDDDLAGRCEFTPVAPSALPHDDAAGVHCVPMGLALGAAVYEPDRCEQGG
jgi:hypothetical protein